jgi:outer membrane protein W
MKIIKLIASYILITVATQAQQGSLRLNFNVTVASPTGAFKEFIDEATWRSWTANVLYGVNDKLSVGLGVGFHDYYQKFPRAVYTLEEGGEISAVVTNSIQTIPMMAAIQYNFMPKAGFQPYIGAGVGGNFIIYHQYLGEFTNNRSDFGFALRPEAGVYIPIGERGFGLNFNGIYNYMPYKKNGMENLNSWGVGAGVRFNLR